MTANEWAQVFDLARAFIVGGVVIGLVAALVVAAQGN